MIQIHKLTYNPVAENSFILSDETKDCVIIDPGCYFPQERQQFEQYITEKGLNPVKVINTHCHFDHVFGVAFVTENWGIEWGCHEKDVPTLKGMNRAVDVYGFDAYQIPPDPHFFIKEGQKIKFGNSELDVLFVPGHAPGHVAFVSHADNFVINGDVLFQGSFGRYDLPGCNFNDLKKSIEEVMFKLPDDMMVCTGHGPETTIGHEKATNPILQMPYE